MCGSHRMWVIRESGMGKAVRLRRRVIQLRLMMGEGIKTNLEILMMQLGGKWLVSGVRGSWGAGP